jgi:hypothetical protein
VNPRSAECNFLKHIRTFLEVAGDGTTEIIQVMDAPPPNA